MKALFALALVLMLSISASATVTSLGPYTISFDLKAGAEPTITTKSESDKESTWYFADIRINNTPVAGIGITRYNDWQDANPSSIESRLKLLLMSEQNKSGEIRDPALIERFIDGHAVEVQSYVSGKSNNSHVIARYWMDDKKVEGYNNLLAGKTVVEIISSGQADINEKLLDTLNITAPASDVETQKSTIVDPAISSTNMHMIKGPDSTSYIPESDYDEESCMHLWTDIGYTSSMIRAIGYC